VDLELSDEEAAFRDDVRGVLAGISPSSVVRAIHEGRGGEDAVWRRMVELDWPALAVAEAYGGIGASFLELAIVVEELGRATAPGPFLATATQFAPAVRELGGDEARRRFLTEVAAGRITGTLALAERGRWDSRAVQTTAAPAGAGWKLSGRKEAVLHGAAVDEIVVIARNDDGLGAFVVPRADVDVAGRDVMDATLPLADVVLDGVVVQADRVLAVPSAGVRSALDRVVDEATVALALASAGTSRRIFEITLEYAKTRRQYGRPIGSFQALKHRLADMYLAVERASSLCWFAALTLAEEDPRRHEAASLAKAAAGECQRRVVAEGLQLHGGIGFTWEHDLHFLLKRAKAGDALFGNAVAHRAALAGMLRLVASDDEAAA
jgi:alkylation response protein AidB-like acyl-CoA dehydrogenase